MAQSAYLDYKRKRNEAVFSYYANLESFLDELRRTIGKKGAPSNVASFLRTGSLPTSAKDRREVTEFRNLARDFLSFFSTSAGQIPLGSFSEWDSLLKPLKKFLHEALFVGVRISDSVTSAEDAEKTGVFITEIDNLLNTIDKMEKSIQQVKSDLDRVAHKKGAVIYPVWFNICFWLSFINLFVLLFLLLYIVWQLVT